MGDCQQRDWQISAKSVRERMDHLFDNPDMSDLSITATDTTWSWGQTSKEFIGHKLVLCSASPVFHQLFFPQENGLEIPSCLVLTKSTNGEPSKLEIQNVPPVAVESLLEYCYKDRFDRGGFENGYSRNLLWRLWDVAKMLEMNHLFSLCCEALDSTMCEETIYWDLNYSGRYQAKGTQHIREKVAELCNSLGNNLFTHPNFVFLDKVSIKELVGGRRQASSEPLVVFNNLLRWAIFQLDNSLLDERDNKRGGDIPVTERTKLITEIREEKVKDFTFSDLFDSLDTVLPLVPWREMSQSDFVTFVAHTNILPQDMLLSASLAIMDQVLTNPSRLKKSSYEIENDPTVVKTELTKAMEKAKASSDVRERGSRSEGSGQRSRDTSITREKADIKAKLEEARQRRMMMESNRLSKNLEETNSQQSNLLLVE